MPCPGRRTTSTAKPRAARASPTPRVDVGLPVNPCEITIPIAARAPVPSALHASAPGRTGKLDAFGVTVRARELGATSDVPPGHNGLYAPGGLPIAIKTALERHCVDAVKSEVVRQIIANTGQSTRYLNGADFRAQTMADYQFKGELIRRLGLGAQ